MSSNEYNRNLNRKLYLKNAVSEFLRPHIKSVDLIEGKIQYDKRGFPELLLVPDRLYSGVIGTEIENASSFTFYYYFVRYILNDDKIFIMAKKTVHFALLTCTD